MIEAKDYSLYLLPFIAAAIGWVTNYLAIKMLFHPRKPMRFLFIEFQGVFPKRQSALASKLGEVVATELLSSKDIAKTFAQNLQGPALIKRISERVKVVLTVDLPKSFPMISMILNPELIAVVQKSFADNISDSITSFVEHLGEPVADSLNVREMVESKVKAFSSDKLEEILFSLMKKEFRFIEISGAVLGFFIGLIQVMLVQYSQW